MRHEWLLLAWVSLAGVAWLSAADAAAIQEDPGVLMLSDVRFPHEFHYADVEIECVTCHHETNAAALKVPHEEYFTDFWANCGTCHGAQKSSSRSCSNCHHDSPVDLADETLSAKVVIHRSCWSCHEVGTGREASRGCKTCHVPAARTEAGERER